MASFNPLAFMELFVVLAFAVGWLVLERVARRFDKRDRTMRPRDLRTAPTRSDRAWIEFRSSGVGRLLAVNFVGQPDRESSESEKKDNGDE
jgi:hypothetical protein